MIIPMNAKPAGSKLEKLMDDPKYIAEVKLDGYRAIFEDGEFYSRLGNQLGDKVPHLVSLLSKYNIILDGELCLPSATSNSSDVTRILGSLPEKAVARQEELGKLRYVIFDVLELGYAVMTGLTWAQRRETLRRWFTCVSDIEGIELSEVYEDKRGLLASVEASGGEGIMLKNVDSLYYPDKRPESVWYKVKKHIIYDVVVMGFTEGKGKYEGLIGAIEFGLYKDGTLTYCGQCSGFSDALRNELTDNMESYENTVFEIKAMERTKDGNFRHPVFSQWRDDKLPTQCLWVQ